MFRTCVLRIDGAHCDQFWIPANVWNPICMRDHNGHATSLAHDFSHAGTLWLPARLHLILVALGCITALACQHNVCERGFTTLHSGNHVIHGELILPKLLVAVLTSVFITNAQVGFVKLHAPAAFHIGATNNHTGHLHGHTGTVHKPIRIIFQHIHLIQVHEFNSFSPAQSAQWSHTEGVIICI